MFHWHACKWSQFKTSDLYNTLLGMDVWARDIHRLPCIVPDTSLSLCVRIEECCFLYHFVRKLSRKKNYERLCDASMGRCHLNFVPFLIFCVFHSVPSALPSKCFTTFVIAASNLVVLDRLENIHGMAWHPAVCTLPFHRFGQLVESHGLVQKTYIILTAVFLNAAGHCVLFQVHT